MSKVKIQGNASGTGVLTVTAPNTSTDRTITLPDATGTLLNSDGDGSNLTGISSVGGATGVDFNDNVAVRLGTGNDLKLIHDGTHSKILNYTGDLHLASDNKIAILGGSDTAETCAEFNDNGAVNLYHNNSKKIETTADGATISGTTVMTGSGQTGNPASSGTTQVDTVAEFSGAGNQRLYVGTDTSSNRMWFQNANPGAFSPRSSFIPFIVVCLTGAALIYGTLDMPNFGSVDAPAQIHVGPDYLVRIPDEVGVPNAVTAILASYRGYDTLGETAVVFAAGIGVMLLISGLRRRRRDDDPSEPEHDRKEQV